MTAYNGVNLPEPADGEVVLGAIVLMKVMKQDGDITYREIGGEALHPIEMLGMIETFRDTLKASIMGRLRPVGSGEDDE